MGVTIVAMRSRVGGRSPGGDDPFPDESDLKVATVAREWQGPIQPKMGPAGWRSSPPVPRPGRFWLSDGCPEVVRFRGLEGASSRVSERPKVPLWFPGCEIGLRNEGATPSGALEIGVRVPLWFPAGSPISALLDAPDVGRTATGAISRADLGPFVTEPSGNSAAKPGSEGNFDPSGDPARGGRAHENRAPPGGRATSLPGAPPASGQASFNRSQGRRRTRP